jgi:hypothetical protein
MKNALAYYNANSTIVELAPGYPHKLQLLILALMRHLAVNLGLV